MVMVNIKGEEKYIDGYLKENLDNLRKAVEKKWDGVGFICGYEGDGKSIFTEQMASYLDPDYNISRCVFTNKQFLDAVDNAKPFECIVFDEGHNAFANTNRYDELNKLIITKLTMIRKKQLFLLIVAPTFFDLRKYLVIHRSRFMVNVYADGLERGFFRFFNRQKKHNLYIYGKKNEAMYAEKPNFIGRFTNWRVLDEIEYEKKKDDSIVVVNEIDKNGKWKLQRDYLIWKDGSPSTQLSAEIGISPSTIRDIRVEMELKLADNPYLLRKSPPTTANLVPTLHKRGRREVNEEDE